jgi:membrane dipeptidase
LRNLLAPLIILIFSSAVPANANPTAESDTTEKAARLARQLLIIDTHIDLPSLLLTEWRDVAGTSPTTDFDYARAKEGGLDVPFMSIYVPSDLEGTGKAKPRAEAMIALVRRMASTWPDKFDLVASTYEVKRKRGSGKILLAMGMENGSPIEGNLNNVEYFHRLGIRYITLAHAKWNHLADGSYDSTRHWNGLSPFGVKVVKEMNRVGIMVDISHLTDSAAFQVLRISGAPVIASHSACRFFTPGFERNMNDELIKALAAKHGVLQINFGSDFLDNRVRLASEPGRKAIDKHIGDEHWDPDGKEAMAYERQYWKEHPRPFATVAQVAAHIDHVAKLVGVDYVGFGSDFDGVGDSLPIGLKDVSRYPNLIAELLRLGYGETDIEKICGGNLLRVWSEVEQVATPGK